MEDKYIRPPMGESEYKLQPIDIVMLVMCIITFITTMVCAIILGNPGDVAEEPMPSDAIIETVEPVKPTINIAPDIKETATIKPEITEPPIPMESFEPEETIEPEENVVIYYDVPLDEELQDHIFAVCEEYQIEPSIVIAIIERESNFKDWVKGDNGNSYGLMQIQKKWHKDRMKRLGVTNLLDPYQNVLVGVDILAELFSRYDDVAWVLMAYNGGASYANDLYDRGVVSAYATGVIESARELREGLM